MNIDGRFNGSYIRKTITIPNGIKVIEVYGYSQNADIFEGMNIKVYSDNKTWFYAEDENIAYVKGYVGVTPNKQYTVTMSASTDSTEDYLDIETFYIKYSPEINNKTPDIYDY